LHINLHEELRSHFLHNAKTIQTVVYIYHLLYRNYYISHCLYAGLVQLQIISQVHYINNATSHNKNSHAIHTNLIRIEHSCKWKEISGRWLTQKQMYNGITLITLHVINNSLAHRWPPMLSERTVYTELELC
jgi:hypothetical protein